MELVTEILGDISSLKVKDDSAAELSRILQEPHFQVSRKQRCWVGNWSQNIRREEEGKAETFKGKNSSLGIFDPQPAVGQSELSLLGLCTSHSLRRR